MRPSRTVQSATANLCHLTNTTHASDLHPTANTDAVEIASKVYAKCGCSCRACTAIKAIRFSLQQFNEHKRHPTDQSVNVTYVNTRSRAVTSSSNAKLASITAVLGAFRVEMACLSLTCSTKELQLTKETCLQQSMALKEHQILQEFLQ